jgi:CRP-like cAMP-binding protein
VVTQKDLASMIGATRESVNKQFKALRTQGILRIDEETIEILNRERLEQKAHSLSRF